MLAPIAVKKRLGAALAFAVTGARACHIDKTAISLGSRMNAGFAMHLARGALQNASVRTFGEPQHIDRPNHAFLLQQSRV
jgi:hypothetical protein